MTTLSGKEIVLGVTGGIAAYKACEIVRTLRKEGAGVRVILTASGARFITPLTLQTLSKNPVYTDLFDLITESDIGHISLAQRANLLVIAPATANILGKIRGGIADDLLSTVAMATAAPVLLAPAMNSQMYASASVQENVEILRERGFTFVDPDEGELACGTVGPGRLADTEKIVEMARILLAEKILAGKRIVVGAGPTAEDIDPVRFLTNRSSGKMGFAMAVAARRFGADVTLVAGPTRLADPPFMRTVRVRSAKEMMRAVANAAETADAVVMAAAVADFRPESAASQKIKKETFDGRLPLVPTEDILASLGRSRGNRVLVGFAAETNDLAGNAVDKMRRKNLDAIVANDVSRPDIGFASDSNEVRVYFSDGTALDLAMAAKDAIASAVWRAVCRKFLPG
ncbi:MAG TPA: bifunctional phosphopantothenoylcysteine decarboxylase/phosphopantothenate--cysteine ligase CoaBC [Candidatus Binatia bacterium]|nr:bifunctional phosphopantothenoylcysteine decarboxylase/phosphopantothenate--cysteine ligase CoaBC [Candidatus Binatia bacterium]